GIVGKRKGDTLYIHMCAREGKKKQKGDRKGKKGERQGLRGAKKRARRGKENLKAEERRAIHRKK
ncbi:hypothetical protein, partial [Bacteroides sp.]|uniref:hypothetical protein n=1 Tax=Bacteroides sp. TaxID=29523 RepID=UPI00258E42B7